MIFFNGVSPTCRRRFDFCRLLYVRVWFEKQANARMILLLTFQDKTLVRVEALRLEGSNYRGKDQSRVFTGTAAAEVLGSINAASARFNTRPVIANERGTIVLASVEMSAGACPQGPSPRRNVSRPQSPATISVPEGGNSPRTWFANGALSTIACNGCPLSPAVVFQ